MDVLTVLFPLDEIKLDLLPAMGEIYYRFFFESKGGANFDLVSNCRKRSLTLETKFPREKEEKRRVNGGRGPSGGILAHQRV